MGTGEIQTALLFVKAMIFSNIPLNPIKHDASTFLKPSGNSLRLFKAVVSLPLLLEAPDLDALPVLPLFPRQPGGILPPRRAGLCAGHSAGEEPARSATARRGSCPQTSQTQKSKELTKV